VVKSDGPEEVHIYPPDVGNSQHAIGFQKVTVLQRINLGQSPHESGLVLSAFTGQRPGCLRDFRRFHSEAYRRDVKTSGQLTYHREQSWKGVEVFMRVQMGWSYATVDDPLNLGGKLGPYGISASGSGHGEQGQLWAGTSKLTFVVKQRPGHIPRRQRPTIGQIKMDSDSKRGPFSGCLDRLSGGGHISHYCGAGQHALGMGLKHCFVHALAKTEIICIHYNAFVHPRKFMQAGWSGQPDLSPVA
jgi:hypothetical protein